MKNKKEKLWITQRLVNEAATLSVLLLLDEEMLGKIFLEREMLPVIQF